MTTEEAREIYGRTPGYIDYVPARERVLIETPSEAIAARIVLDGEYTALELEAILTLMRCPTPEQELKHRNS